MINNANKSERVLAFSPVLAEAIRELKEVPNGHLYARVMSCMTYDTYEACISTLKLSGAIVETGNVLRWVEKKK